MSANFFAAVAYHEPLLRSHPDYQGFLLEATQFSMASKQQRMAMQVRRVSLSSCHACVVGLQV
jgi:hypothetical protein